MKITKTTIDQVIKGWLNGKTKNHLAKEIGISAGSVTNIVDEWNEIIAHHEAEELREFSVWVRKSGMTVTQSVKAIRIHQLIKNLIVGDETNLNVEGEDIDNFHSFVVETFNGCKDLGLSPKHLIECIGDLIEFSNSNPSLPSLANDMDIINNPSSEMTPNSHITDKKPVYITKISDYINQKRQQNEQTDQQAMTCQDVLIQYKCEVIMAKNRLDGILKENNITITQVHWLVSLKKGLLLKCGSDAIEKAKEFAKVIRDLESFGYDPKILLKKLSDKIHSKTN